MAEYTPTTNGIRNRYLWWYEQQRDGGAKNFTKYPDEVLAQFDRWLTQHDARTREELLVRLADSGVVQRDRQIAEAVWDQCVASIQYESGEPVEIVGGVNPYRVQEPSNITRES